MSQLSPALALLPDSNSIRATPQSLIMQRDPQGDYFLISSTDSPDAPLFQVDAPSFSVSYKKKVVDRTSNRDIFTIRHVIPSKNWTCVAEAPTGSDNVIFETQLYTSVLGGFRIDMMFQNAASHNNPQQQTQREKLELKVPPWSKTQSVTYNGTELASISRARQSSRETYTLTIPANCDPLLVIALVTIMDAKARESADLDRRSRGKVAASADGIMGPSAGAFIMVGGSGGGGC